MSAAALLAYHDDPSLKVFVLDQLALHREADKLVKGTYWEAGRGCAVGCTLEAVRLRSGKKKIDRGDHALYETELGIPRILARLEDRLFESLPNGESQAWPERFARAIRPGADLTMIWPRFAFWLLTEEIPPRTKNKRSLASLAEVAALYREWIDGAKPSVERWLSAKGNAHAAYAAAYAAAAADAYAAAAADAAAYAAAAADAAAYAAADAAAYAAAAADAAAYAAAYADAYAAAYADAYAAAAADAAAYAAAAAAAARIDSFRRQSDKLIELLEAA